MDLPEDQTLISDRTSQKPLENTRGVFLICGDGLSAAPAEQILHVFVFRKNMSAFVQK